VTVDRRSAKSRPNNGWLAKAGKSVIAWPMASWMMIAALLPGPSFANGWRVAELSGDAASPPAATEATPMPPASTAVAPVPPAAQDSSACPAGVTFTRNLKYGGDDRNILDIATAQTRPDAKRPILVFIAGEEFSGGQAPAAPDGLVEKAMCFAAGNALVAAHVSYRLAPAATWPAGAVDVAAAISWVFENADLFGGNAQEIIAVGYGVGAFHLASFLSHREFQDKDDTLAGAVLVSGIYDPTKDADEGERAYLGPDVRTYSDRSALAGLTALEEPLVLAWSSADAPQFAVQGERLRKSLCDAGHCPRTAILGNPSSLASIFDLDGTSADLHERLRQLISQLDARGLP
jgi:acetyl esterase/lipase